MTEDPTQTTWANDDRTVAAPRKTAEIRPCPACGTENTLEHLQKREYRCSQCNLELAHLDYNVNGAVRGVFGWLLSPGAIVLEKYRIQSVLGKGGFGAAYLVDDIQLNNRRRALKEVPQSLFDEYETTLLSRLDHSAIPDIIERKAVNGMVYLVLKFGGSRTLGSERKQSPERRIPLEKLLPWMRQLCEVLIYLHGQNPPIIHRDLKPDNILLNEEDKIMLIDFGIAKEAIPEGLTRTLGRAATFGFSPPEQVMGTGTDERADIYALGATFYALLTGRNPPGAHERVAGKELEPPSHFVPDVPLEIEEAILQALNLNMNHRQQTVRAFAQSLEGAEPTDFVRSSRTASQAPPTQAMGNVSNRLATGKPSSLKLPTGRATAPKSRQSVLAGDDAVSGGRNLAVPLVILAAVILGLIVAAYFLWFKGDKQPEPAKQSAPIAPVTQPAVTAPPAVITPPVQQPVQVQPQTTPVAPAPIAPSPVPAVQPAPTASPTQPSSGQPQGGAISAEELLKKNRVPSVEEPSSAPAPASNPESVSRPKVVKPVVKAQPAPPPRPRTVAPVERPRPQPSGGGDSGWNIIRGGAQKTD